MKIELSILWPPFCSILRKYNQLQGLFCANAEIAQIAYYAVIQMKRTPGVDFEIVSFDPPYLPGFILFSKIIVPWFSMR